MTVRIITADVFDGLAQIDADSVDCVVTSPPYWGLRDYGTTGQIGLESTLGEHLEVMVRVFGEVRRVLKPAGTVWLNYGDCYAATPSGSFGKGNNGRGMQGGEFKTNKPFSTVGGYFKPKDLCMMANRLAIALQDDGWWVRSEIIWHKPNPMPESVTDRPTSVHEKIWLLTKSQRYWYDAEAVREARQGNTHSRGTKRTPPIDAAGQGHKDWVKYMTADDDLQDRNLRNVWTIPTHSFSQAHFATFPPDLVEPCIKAGCPEIVCAKCGAPHVRNISVTYDNPGGRTTNGPRSLERRHETAGFDKRLEKRVETLGFSPSCKCAAGVVANGVVLDPFGGSGTVGMVADRLGRDAILIELNPEYAAMAERRIKGDAPLFTEVKNHVEGNS